MKRFLKWSMLICSLIVVSCGTDKPGGGDSTDADYLAEFSSFGFFADDNEGTFDLNYPGVISGSTITVYMPEYVDKTSLTPKFAVSENDVVKVGATVFESGKTSYDFSNTVDFIVSDNVSKMSKVYSVKIVKPIAKVWTKVGELAQKSFAIRNTNFSMKMDPYSEKPYIVYSVDAVVDAVTETKLNVAKWTGTEFVLVGAEGFSNKSSGSVDIALNSKTGQPYVSYVDATNATPETSAMTTILTYNGSAWVNVGTPGFTYKTNTSYAALCLDEKENPVFLSVGNTNGDPTYRAPELAYWTGSTWVAKLTMPGRPAVSGTSYATMRIASRRYGDKVYLATGNNGTTNGYSIYTLKDGSVTTLLEGKLIDPGSSATSMQDLSFAFASDGTIYFLSADDTGGAWKLRIFTYKEGDAAPKQFGSTIAHVVSGSSSYNIALDNYDIPYVAYANAAEGNMISVVSYDPEARTWMTPVQISATKYKTNPQKIFLEFDSNNVGYLGAVTNTSPYVFHLYKLLPAN